jgi:DNA-binding winged helix-turn-helix (wHTH) protein
VRFERFELEQGSDRLRRSGSAIDLQPQPARLLRYLVERSGQVVPRDELLFRLWGTADDPRLDQRLHFCIAQIRQALGDSAEEPVFIETVPRRGYRFLQPVRPLRSRRWGRFSVAVVVLIALVGIGVSWWRVARAAPAVVDVVSLALEDVPAETGSRFAEMLRDALVQASERRRFRVVAPDAQPGRRQAEFQIEGRLSGLPRGVRVTVRLRRSSDGVYLWADHYVWTDGAVGSAPPWLEEVAVTVAARITGS